MDTRQKAGQIYLAMKAKQQDKADVVEHVRTTKADFMPKLVELVDKSKPNAIGDFYVEVCFRNNYLMPDLEEAYMKARHTCPTPFPDRAVFRYIKNEDRITFLWHVPSLQEMQYYLDNVLYLRPDEKEAAQNVFDYKDGTLLKLAKTLNGETNDYELTFFRKDANGQPITS